VSLPRDVEITTLTDTYIEASLVNLDKRHAEIQAEIDALRAKQEAIAGEVEVLVKEKVRRAFEASREYTDAERRQLDVDWGYQIYKDNY